MDLNNTLHTKENTVLYAQWSKDVKQYKLVYHSNYPSKAEETKEEQKEIFIEKNFFMGSRNNCSANNGIGDICDHVK